MDRTTLSVLLAPAFAAVLICMNQLALSSLHAIILVPTFVFAYFFAIIPTAFVMGILKAFNCRSVWAFTFAGLAAGILATYLFVGTFPSERFSQFWSFMIIGPLSGLFAWFVAETRLMDWLKGLAGGNSDGIA